MYGSLNPSIVNAIVDAIVVLAHGQFLHPDAEVLADFLHHGRQDTKRQGGALSSHGQQHGPARPSVVQEGVEGQAAATAAAVLPPPKPTPASVSGSLAMVDSQSSTPATSISSVAAVPSGRGTTAGDIPKGGGGGGGGRGHGEGVELGEGAGVEARGMVTVVPAPPRRGSKGTCMVRV